MATEEPSSEPDLPGTIQRHHVLRLAAGWEAEDHLAAEALQARSDAELVAWLTHRATLLPLLGWSKPLVRDVASLDLAAQQEYFEALTHDLLAAEEQATWHSLRLRYEQTATQLVAFWRQRRAPPRSE